MDITIEILEAKRQSALEGIKQHDAAMQANYGALQVLDELIAVAKAEKPKQNDKGDNK